MLDHVPDKPDVWDTVDFLPDWYDPDDEDTLPADLTDGELGGFCPASWRGWLCTRSEGHTGRHYAGTMDIIAAVWPPGHPGSEEE